MPSSWTRITCQSSAQQTREAVVVAARFLKILQRNFQRSFSGLDGSDTKRTRAAVGLRHAF